MASYSTPSGHTPMSLSKYVYITYMYEQSWSSCFFDRPITDESIWLCGHHTTV